MSYRITAMAGDGIGMEILPPTMRVMDATGVPIDWDIRLLGKKARRKFGDGLPEKTLRAIEKNGLGLKGPTATSGGRRSYNVRLREEFDLYANVRPVHSWKGIHTFFSSVNIDIVLIRENSEDLYIGKERLIKGGAEAIARFTKKGCRRIMRFAFEYARSHGRKRVCVACKDNINPLTHGLFRAAGHEVAKEIPDIEYDDFISDNFFQKVVQHPDRFDVVVMPNFLGDHASDLLAGMIGGLGYAPGINIGKKVAIAEAVHGTAPDIAGKGIANPASLILSGAELLDHMGERAAAEKIQEAMRRVVAQRRYLTADRGVSPDSKLFVGTGAFADAIIRTMERI